ncbi:MAG: TRAP transporter small permease subunit [Burkholderiaceae bacterium]|jgi:TRAP-type mannitol/chloroaromatic compound transport system permease small subunit
MKSEPCGTLPRVCNDIVNFSSKDIMSANSSGTTHTEPSEATKRLLRGIDHITEVTGNVFAWLMVPLVGAVVWEVVSRYFFHKPTEWSYDLTYMLYGSLFMLGAAYTLRRGAHIRTDFLWDNFSNKTKGWIDTVAYVALFFPTLALLFMVGVEEFSHAFAISERSEQTVWRPLLWPMKLSIPVCFFLLMLQGISELVKAWYLARTGEELDHREKVEI